MKTALLEETSGKCAYCEGRVDETGYPRVDHIMPRRFVPELTLAWANLTIAGEICKRNESDYWDLALPLLNPPVDDPARHLWAPTEWIQDWRDAQRGNLAIKRLGLNRGGLVERRLRRSRRRQGLTHQWRDAPTPRENEGYWQALQYEPNTGKEYLLMTGSLVGGLAI